jgi:signal transduction histidine kinase
VTAARIGYGLAGVAALACGIVGRVTGADAPVEAAWTIAGAAAAASACASALRSGPSRRRPRTILAVALSLWLAGQLIWDVRLLAFSTPGFPSASDATWLLAALGLCATAVSLRTGAAGVRRVLGLDALAVIVGVAALGLGWLYEPIARSHLGDAAVAFAVAYVVLYGAAIVLWVDAIATTPGVRGRAAFAVLAGVVLNGIAWLGYASDTLTERFTSGHSYDLLWVVGQLALGAGPLLAHRDEPLVAPNPLEPLRRRALLPAVAFLALIATAIGFAVADQPLGARLALQLGVLVVGGVLYFRDRLATRLAEQLWQERNQELEAFAHSASHDLKAPLVSIQGLASSLERTNGERLDDKGRLYLERIQANAGSMQQLVEDLLLFARVGVDRPYGPIDADAIARAAVEEACAGGAAVELLTPIPPVRAHPVRFRQALANLIDNGVRYGRSAVRVSARSLADCVEVAVEDDGPGIDPGEREQVFELFTRGRAGLAAAPDGTGFGLALVRRIAVASGGSVRYEPAPSGARFVLSLPKATR